MENNNLNSWDKDPKQTYWQFVAATPGRWGWMAIVIGIASTFIVYTLVNLEVALEASIGGLIICGLLSIGMVIGAFYQPYSEWKQYLKQ